MGKINFMSWGLVACFLSRAWPAAAVCFAGCFCLFYPVGALDGKYKI